MEGQDGRLDSLRASQRQNSRKPGYTPPVGGDAREYPQEYHSSDVGNPDNRDQPQRLAEVEYETAETKWPNERNEYRRCVLFESPRLNQGADYRQEAETGKSDSYEKDEHPEQTSKKIDCAHAEILSAARGGEPTETPLVAYDGQRWSPAALRWRATAKVRNGRRPNVRKSLSHRVGLHSRLCSPEIYRRGLRARRKPKPLRR